MENLRKDYRARVREDLLTEAASDTNKVKFFQEQFQVSQGFRLIVRGTWWLYILETPWLMIVRCHYHQLVMER